MNLTKFGKLVTFGLILTVAVSACRKRPTDITVLPKSRAGAIQDVPPGGILDPSKTGMGDENVSGRNEGIPFGEGHAGWTQNPDALKQYTVYFDFDSSAIKGSEQSKIASVADQLKGQPSAAVLVEGHCDERGTEEYNRALGERRALAIRTELVRLGVDPNRVDTISYGKDRPAEPGHSDAAYAKNRRGQFVLLTPPASP